tara:strand:- start:2713 stop:4128 length:1416 start_codon:yes stop_codon:yes gene_type:complete
MALLVLSSAPSAGAETFRRHQDYVLGTSFDLTVVAKSESQADAAERAILTEIARLEAILSTYSPESEISRLNTAGHIEASPELLEVLTECETYRDRTSNAFSCRIGELLDAWHTAEASGVKPDSAKMRLLAGEIRRADLAIDQTSSTVSISDPIQLNVNALAKGFILDAAIAEARSTSPEVTGILLNIGGDIASWGSKEGNSAWKIAIGSPSLELNLSDGAVATSGDGPRSLKIGDETFSHIISPGDGWPVDGVQVATVFAPTAFQADALATLLSVLPLNDGLKWIEDLHATEARITASDGRSYATSGWSKFEKQNSSKKDQAPSGIALEASFVIPEQKVPDYERPYVSAWISDTERNLVRILLLAGDEPRWMEENYYWYRRFGRKAGSLVDAKSGPTRRPGEYELNWDGRDHDGNVVPAGEYVFHIEASREHGSHQHDSISFKIGDQGQVSETLKPGEELGRVTLSIDQE